MLSSEERSRYARHYNLPNFGESQQQALKDAKVLVVGAGGLGSPLLLYLAAAGVGNIGIIDDDKVDISNLQRQILYDTADIGSPKATTSSKKLKRLNPHVQIQTYNHRLTTENALDIIANYDIVADGTDNFPTRYLVNDACVLLGKINIYASIYQYEGQVSVFNYSYDNGNRGPHYRDLFPTPPAPNLVSDCATGGVLGVLAGIVGNFQALEVIKCIAKIGTPLVGRILIYDALTSSSRIIKFAKQSQVAVTKLINYQEFCGLGPVEKNENMSSKKSITVQELKQWRDEGIKHQLIDVRDLHEVTHENIGGEHISMNEVLERKDEIKKDLPVVMMCRSGGRSGAVIDVLSREGFNNLINLQGGIIAWTQHIDNTLSSN